VQKTEDFWCKNRDFFSGKKRLPDGANESEKADIPPGILKAGMTCAEEEGRLEGHYPEPRGGLKRWWVIITGNTVDEPAGNR